MTIRLGDNNIGKIYLGNAEIGKVYLGEDLVYSTEEYDFLGIDSSNNLKLFNLDGKQRDLGLRNISRIVGGETGLWVVQDTYGRNGFNSAVYFFHTGKKQLIEVAGCNNPHIDVGYDYFFDIFLGRELYKIFSNGRREKMFDIEPGYGCDIYAHNDEYIVWKGSNLYIDHIATKNRMKINNDGNVGRDFHCIYGNKYYHRTSTSFLQVFNLNDGTHVWRRQWGGMRVGKYQDVHMFVQGTQLIKMERDDFYGLGIYLREPYKMYGGVIVNYDNSDEQIRFYHVKTDAYKNINLYGQNMPQIYLVHYLKNTF